MTVIVGICSANGVLLGADRMVSDPYGGDQRILFESKVVKFTDCVAMASCGSPRLSQVLKYDLEPFPKLPLGMDEHKWAVKEFIPAAREACLAAGTVRVYHEVETLVSHSAFLLAVRNRLFTVYSDWQVSEVIYPWATAGSGGEVAAGHLRGVLKETIEPVDKKKLKGLATKAIETAIDLNAFVGGGPEFVQTVRFSDREREIAEEVLSV